MDKKHKQWIDDKIERALEQVNRGEVLSAEESRARMEKDKAAGLKERNSLNRQNS